jgi:transcriptional regulator with XRE-family HTH domain
MTTTVAARIDAALRGYSGTKTQTEIARATGFNNPNMLAMIKNGSAKLPMKRIPALCRELGIEMQELLLLAMKEEYADPERNPLWIAFGGRLPLIGELRSLAATSAEGLPAARD